VACIAGAIAEAHYGGVPDHIRGRVLEYLDDRLAGIVDEFTERYGERLLRAR
jgi:ADP-ribosylglycohydrolase